MGGTGEDGPRVNGLNNEDDKKKKKSYCYKFQMPLHYPKLKTKDYEKMPEWKLDCLLKEYGLSVHGDVHQKRNFAVGAFVWPDQLDV